MKAWAEHPERFRKSGPKLWKSNHEVYLNPSNETRMSVPEILAAPFPENLSGLARR
jgi:hypothetical protein